MRRVLTSLVRQRPARMILTLALGEQDIKFGTRVVRHSTSGKKLNDVHKNDDLQ